MHLTPVRGLGRAAGLFLVLQNSTLAQLKLLSCASFLASPFQPTLASPSQRHRTSQETPACPTWPASLQTFPEAHLGRSLPRSANASWPLGLPAVVPSHSLSRIGRRWLEAGQREERPAALRANGLLQVPFQWGLPFDLFLLLQAGKGRAGTNGVCVCAQKRGMNEPLSGRSPPFVFIRFISGCLLLRERLRLVFSSLLHAARCLPPPSRYPIFDWS